MIFSRLMEKAATGGTLLKKDLVRPPRSAILLKRDSNTGVFCESCRYFKNTFLLEHLQWLPLNIWKKTMIGCKYLEIADDRDIVKKRSSWFSFPVRSSKRFWGGIVEKNESDLILDIWNKNKRRRKRNIERKCKQ